LSGLKKKQQALEASDCGLFGFIVKNSDFLTWHRLCLTRLGCGFGWGTVVLAAVGWGAD
jgi:hypothetical protein